MYEITRMTEAELGMASTIVSSLPTLKTAKEINKAKAALTATCRMLMSIRGLPPYKGMVLVAVSSHFNFDTQNLYYEFVFESLTARLIYQTKET